MKIFWPAESVLSRRIRDESVPRPALSIMVNRWGGGGHSRYIFKKNLSFCPLFPYLDTKFVVAKRLFCLLQF